MNASAPRPLVTVMLPVYNGSAYLQQALDSIFAQSFRDFELLAIDDGSTDSSPEILRAVRDPRFRCVTHEKNMGLVATLNHALEIARGEFFARQDHDDISFPRRLQKQVDYLRAHPDVVLVGTEAIQTDARGNKAFRLFRPENPESVRWYLCFDNPFIHSSVMFRRDVVWKEFGGYVTPCFPAEDYALWSRMARERKMANLTEPLLYYREHGGSAWGSLSAQGMTKLEEITCEIRLENLQALVGDRVPSGGEAQLQEWAHHLSTYRRQFDARAADTFLTILEQLAAWTMPKGESDHAQEWPAEYRRIVAVQYAELAYRLLPVARWKALRLYGRALKLYPDLIGDLPWTRIAALFALGENARKLVAAITGR